MKSHEAAAALAALAHPQRLEMFQVVAGAGEEGMPAGKIAKSVKATSTGASFHLKELERAGLFKSRREGQSIVYSVDLQTWRRLRTHLDAYGP